MFYGILCLKVLYVVVYLIFVLKIFEWKNFFFVNNCCDWGNNILNILIDMVILFSFRLLYLNEIKWLVNKIKWY